LGGHTLLTKYDFSFHSLLSALYPEYNWLSWKFLQKGYWGDVNNQKKFMDWVAWKLNYKEMSDWYKITLKVKISRYNIKISGFVRDWCKSNTKEIQWISIRHTVICLP
jgi:hypothetical protein